MSDSVLNPDQGVPAITLWPSGGPAIAWSNGAADSDSWVALGGDSRGFTWGVMSQRVHQEVMEDASTLRAHESLMVGKLLAMAEWRGHTLPDGMDDLIDRVTPNPESMKSGRTLMLGVDGVPTMAISYPLNEYCAILTVVDRWHVCVLSPVTQAQAMNLVRLSRPDPMS